MAISAFRISGSYLELDDEPETTATKKKKNSVEETCFGEVGIFGHLDKARKE